MKVCKKCKNEVSNSKWAYKDDLCTKCYGRKKYMEKRPELTKMVIELEKKSKDELINIITSHRGNRGNINMLFARKNYQIKNMRMRLFKIKNSIDYLLKHPYSMDTTYKTKPHKRDSKKRRMD